MTGARSVLALLVAVAVLVAAVPVQGAAQEQPRERLVVELEPDGDATVTTVITYDLTDDADRRAFEALSEDPGNLTADYAAGLRSVAAGVAAETGREMSVSDPAATFERSGDVGVIRLSVTWSNLAAVDGDRLVVSAPFDDGFEPDRPLVLRAPEGYEIADTAVSPAERSGGRATWSSEADLSGFSATVAPASANPLAPSLAVPVAGLVLGAGLVALRGRFAGR